MRLLFLLLVFSTLLSHEIQGAERDAAVSYNYKRGRFGDQLLAFSHALWFSYVLDLPLVYEPFAYSDQLQMHKDPSLISKRDFSETRKLVLNTRQDYVQFLQLLNNAGSLRGVLFEIPYYPESRYLYDGRPQPQFTEVNWKDPKFLSRLRALIAPRKTLPKMKLPEERISVALHYRSGLVYDKSDFTQKYPLKGPPDTYYRDALTLLSQIVAKPLYVRLFTDHPDPLEVRKMFLSYFSDVDLVLECRSEETGPDCYVLEDFFGMGEFDCLIRPESNFSIMASLLFPFKMIISPFHFHKNVDDTIEVDEFQLEYRARGQMKSPICTILRKEALQVSK